MLYQPAKAFLTASYRQFIVKAAGVQNATASCFLCGSNQKKTAGQGQHRQAFLLLQTDESPCTRPWNKNALCHKWDSAADYIPPSCGIINHSQKIHESFYLFQFCWMFVDHLRICVCRWLSSAFSHKHSRKKSWGRQVGVLIKAQCHKVQWKNNESWRTCSMGSKNLITLSGRRRGRQDVVQKNVNIRYKWLFQGKLLIFGWFCALF